MTPLDPVRPRTAIMRQQWRDIAFLHWRVDPAVVAPLLPAGTEPDMFDGATWVGLIPFRMVGAGIGRGPAVPVLGSFAETNVRLYSVDAAGRRGVVFLSLEAQRLAVVLGARAVFAIPYMWATMQVTRDADTVTYTTSRRWPRAGGDSSPSESATITVRPGRPVPRQDEQAAFLTARWGLHTRIAGQLFYVPNHHEPWPLREASVLQLSDTLVAAAGLPGVVDRPPDSVLFSTGVTTEFGLPQRVSDGG